MTPGPLVRFVIGGVQKGGTTALATYLARHPMVRLPATKEAHVFDAADFDDGWDAASVDARFRDRYKGSVDGGVVGDATPIYLFHPRFVERVARYNPRMQWIILLRDPVERAVSHYHMERARGRERWPMWAAMLFERWRLRGHRDDLSARSPLRTHSYRTRGDYRRQIDALLRRFPREQVLLLGSSTLRSEPAATLERVHRFLELPPHPGAADSGAADFAPVFEGHYRRNADPVSRLMLRWLLRRERKDMRGLIASCLADRAPTPPVSAGGSADQSA